MAQVTVSIILPTYNRERFLPDAFESIRGQGFRDWELIVVDDGSADRTEELVARFGRASDRPLRYVRQANQGAYAARNLGLGLASGEFIAFFDSDDIWLPHHLGDCVDALGRDRDIDWVYGAARRVEYETGRILTPHCFYVGDEPRPFLRLRTRDSGATRIIEDPRVIACSIEQGLFCGLQNSVIRRRVFEALRFQTSFRNESEDQVFVVRALANGFRIAYIDNVHLIYSVHDQNSSATADGLQVRRHIDLLEEQARGFEELGSQVDLNAAERRALNRRLGREYFWCLGYAVLLSNGLVPQAMEAMRRGISKWPLNLSFLKCYAVNFLRHALIRRTPRLPRLGVDSVMAGEDGRES